MLPAPRARQSQEEHGKGRVRQLTPKDLNLKLDFKSGVPVYVQLEDQLKYLISSGLLPAGRQLPTVRAMAVQLNINPNTVSKVYALLERSGFIFTHKGRGSFVADVARTEADEEALRQCQRLVEETINKLGHLGLSDMEIQDLVERTLRSRKESK